MRSFADAKAVVTGAGGGIGRAIAQRLSNQGVRVALVSRSAEKLARVERDVGGSAFPTDLSDAAEVGRLTTQLHAYFGGAPDIAINAAGAFELAPVVETDAAGFDQMIAINLRAPFLLVRAFLPGMLARGSGHIVSIGSVAGRRALAGNGAYSASKYGLRGLHEVLALELKGSGVRATLIEPAATDTALWDAIDRDRHQDLPTREEMLSAETVADAVLFALSTTEEANIQYMGVERS